MDSCLATMIPNRNRYLASLSEELSSQATRVRDLIGDRHWLSDGHHKEYLVKHAIARHLPTGILVSRGFVAHPSRSDLVSGEQDLIFVDTLAEAPIFDQGGLCVAFPHQVIAAVAIKTKFQKSELVDACKSLHALKRVAAYAGTKEAPWCGVLFFEGDNTPDDQLNCKLGTILAEFESEAEKIPNGANSTPDVISVLGRAGFLVDSCDAEEAKISVRGFSGDGTVVLLHRLMMQFARVRGANASATDDFMTGFPMTPLPGSPHTGG